MTCEAWPITWPCDINGVSQEALDTAQSLAQQLLWALSGYRIGVCDYHDAIHPECLGTCPIPYKGPDGNWYNGMFWTDCCKLLLDHRPVWEVTEVALFGQVLDPSFYALQGNYLMRRDVCWPCGPECTDAPITVKYSAGVPFPAWADVVMGEVACEFLAALDNKPCKLPSRVTNISRQGISVTLGDAADFIGKGKLGLPLADAWLTAVNGTALRMPSKVFSPDLPKSYAVRA